MMTRLLAAVCIATALIGASAAADEQEFGTNENRAVYQIDIRDSESRHSSIETLLVVSDDATLVAKTRHGIGRRNQDRVDYSFVPLLGKLSEHRYDKSDLSPANRVGRVLVDGVTLYLSLDAGAKPALADIRRIAVLNESFAFETRRRPKYVESAGRLADRGREIGGVYWTGGETLIALIRPFVVTDSGLW